MVGIATSGEFGGKCSRDSDIAFHTCPSIKQSFKEGYAMKRKYFKPSVYSSMCSVHFRSEDFDTELAHKNRRLKDGAIPTTLKSTNVSRCKASLKKGAIITSQITQV